MFTHGATISTARWPRTPVGYCSTPQRVGPLSPRYMFAAIIIIYDYYLDCFHPPWLFDLIVHHGPIFTHRLVPCSHADCVLTEEGENRERENILQNGPSLGLVILVPRPRKTLPLPALLPGTYMAFSITDAYACPQARG